MSSVDLSLIIISLNSRHYLEGCLESMKTTEWRNTTYEIIVVDNGSSDGSVDMMRAQHPDVIVIANQKNVGFCPAGNQGAAIAKGRYLMFLNDDILILDDAFPKLIEWMDANPHVGMIGPRLLNPDGSDQFSSGRTFPTPAAALFGRKSILTKLFPNARWAKGYLLSDCMESAEPFEVDWLSAAAMIARREPFFAVGGLVDDFYYFHEQIICDRIKRLGHPIYLHPKSKIIHYEGAGSGVRTGRVRRGHIRSFHIAAFKWYCLHRGIGNWNPVRLPMAAILGARAAALMLADAYKFRRSTAFSRAEQDLQTGRPEGGIPQ